MPHKEPQNYSHITYLWVFAMSMLGGVSHNIKKLRDGTLARFSFSELIGDLIISGFLGIVTFFFCEYEDLDHLLTAALIGMSAYQGTRGIYFIEELIVRKFKLDTEKKDAE